MFGIGADWPVQTWRSLMRQLIVRGFVHVDHARYGALVLTDASRPLLRGDVKLRVREDATDVGAAQEGARRARRPHAGGRTVVAGAARLPQAARDASTTCRRT